MKPDFAILTPISVEWAAMCAILSQSETPPAARLPTKTGYVGNHLVVCIKSGKGQANTAAALQHVFDTWAPRWVLLIGIAGGFPEVGVHRGDIIVAKHVLGVDFGKLTDGKYVRRPEYDFSADVRLLGHSEVVVDDSDQRWRQHINIGRPDGAPVSQSNAHAGYVASGDKVVDDPSHSFFVEVRASLPEVHAVEMEGVGAGASVRLESTHRVVGFLMIRGISDEPGHANKSATSGSSQRTLWSKYASAAVAAFVKQFLLEFPYTASIDDPLSVEQRGEARGLPPKVTSRASFMLPVGRSRQIIGRREERARLRDYLELARQGHSQLVLVAGPSGIGKTRLIGAIAEEALAGNALVLTGHIDPHQAPYRPFLPFISAFREYLNSAQLPTVQAALVNAPDLPRLLPELRDLSRTTMISAVAAPYEERLRLFESVTQFLRSITPSAGLVLMIEDIQAADAGTIALLNHLARESQGLRILILGTYRDDEATSNEWVDDVVLELESKRLLVRVTLKQLGVEHTRALLSDILETEVPQEFGSVIFTATEGNPLFVEEVVRTLIEEGSLFKGENGWVFPSPADLRVPPTIRATVRIRLARLSAECRQALSHASVIGREFRPGPLSTLLRKGRGRVLRLLDEAVAAHVVDVSPPNDAVTYAFRNPLIVQALYESLGMYERTRLHSRMAAHLESAYEGATLEHSAEIAYHCARGALSSRSEMSRAVQYMTLAGDRASALCAYEDALTHYEEAVALLEDRGRKSESVFLWEKIGDLRARLLSRVEASEAYARAIAKWRALKNKDTASGLRLYSKVVAVTRWGVRHPDVIAFAEEGLRMTGPDALSVERARLLTGLAFARHWRISFSEKDFFAATRAGEEAWRIANALDDAVEMNAALDALSSIQAEQGDVPGALEVTRKRLELSDRLDVTEQSDTLDMLARYTAQLGEYRLALRYEKEAGDLVGKLRLYEWDLTSVWVSIMILLQWDRWAEASAKIAQFIGTEVPVKLRSWSRESFPTLGRIAAALGVLRGDEEEGLRIARAAQRIRVEGEDVNRSFRASHERVYLIQVLIALGRFGEAEDALREHEQSAMHPETGLEAALLRAECAAALGNTDARTLGTAVEVRIQAWDRPRRARVGRAIGVGCAAAGEFEEATHRLEGALGLFKAIDTAWQQGRTLVAMGEVWERSGQPARAKERYEEAVASFELVGARRDSEATRARLEIGSRAS